MTNYREILRLHSLGLNKIEIASSCQCARNTVAATLQRAANCVQQWPLPEEMSDKQLSERLFPSSTSKPVYKMPDYALLNWVDWYGISPAARHWSQYSSHSRFRVTPLRWSSLWT